jgi:hypothetical protein
VHGILLKDSRPASHRDSQYEYETICLQEVGRIRHVNQFRAPMNLKILLRQNHPINGIDTINTTVNRPKIIFVNASFDHFGVDRPVTTIPGRNTINY